MLVGKGLLWGNAVGLLICWVQQQFRLISLDASVYYIDSVPIRFDWLLILGINVATFLISTLVIWGSSHLISIGKPSETMRYEKDGNVALYTILRSPIKTTKQPNH